MVKKMKRKELTTLIVEDYEHIGRIITRALNTIDITKVYLAKDEQEGITLILKIKPELMILDTLFDSSYPYGPEILARTRKSNYEPKLVIVSSGDSNNKSLWIGESKVDHFLVKPYSILELLKIVKDKFPE